MAYVFLSVTFLLWAGYFVRTDLYVADKNHIFEINGFVVTAIIAALSAKGLLIAHSKVDLSSLTLGELEAYMVHQGLSQDEWNTACFSFQEGMSFFDYGLDLDFG